MLLLPGCLPHAELFTEGSEGVILTARAPHLKLGLVASSHNDPNLG